ncbi:DUF6227 family protein [Streptomyces sp. NPDC006879]|uniref:DUF6227 family protein n=1 Tax=Streptomyces sp. NPDC006879 TaxID=3364767 RepID=UPI0036999848
MSDPYETAEAHLQRLLGRALNSYDLPDGLVDSLAEAFAHSSSLHASCRSSLTGLRCDTYRHGYLLGDGSPVVLWELVHRADESQAPRHELFATKAEAALAADRIVADWAVDERFDSAVDLAFSPESGDPQLGLLGSMLCAASGPVESTRPYAVDQSADHARRLLRRAENLDRPGEEMAQRLRGACAHQITQAFGQCRSASGRGAGFTLYEHAFVLLDGSECSLWEVEHTATPDGRHMCEVYLTEETARSAMELRARVSDALG